MKHILLFLLIATSSLFSSELIDQALAVREQAYAPYSNFQVGAALLMKSGNIYTGCNVENASYGMVICAERAAVCKAIAAGESEIEACCVCVQGGGTPCGACRQVLNEFNPNMLLICVDENGKVVVETSLDQLLPHAFGPHNLEKN